MAIDHRDRGTPTRALVLLSGGIDSLAAAHYCRSKGWQTSGIFVDFGQPARGREAAAAKAVATRLGIDLQCGTMSGFTVPEHGEILGRNGWLVQTALMATGPNDAIIAIGIHAGTDYADCSPAFIEKMQQLLGLQASGQVQLFAPFLTWTKAEVWDFCRDEGLPVELTYSCERGLDQPCGQCATCSELTLLHARS
jgi:7-cyano-7-deazaguanine synthase